MADGSMKILGDLKKGEFVLGPDGKGRRVVGVPKGLSEMIAVREQTRNRAHLEDKFMGLMTFACTPGQPVYLATPQDQSEVTFDKSNNKNRLLYRHVKERGNNMSFVVSASKYFTEAQIADAEHFKITRGKDVLYWSLPPIYHHRVSMINRDCSFLVAAPIDFDFGRFKKLCLEAGFPIIPGLAEKVAYLFGVWIGDGDSIGTRISVNKNDTKQIARLQDICFEMGLWAYESKQSPSEKARNSQGGHIPIISRREPRRN